MTRASEPASSRATRRDTVSAVELAAFIADMSAELAGLSGKAGWPVLTYLLNTVRVEAEARVVEEGKRLGPGQMKRVRRRKA